MSGEYAAVRAGSAEVLLSAMFTNFRASYSKTHGGARRRGMRTHVRSEMKCRLHNKLVRGHIDDLLFSTLTSLA